MRREFNKSNDFQNPDIEPPLEFSMDDYDKAVQDPEYLQRTTEPFVETPTVSDPSPAPEIKQEPEEEGPIVELPQNETAPKPTTRKSRETKNLESALDEPKWQCTENHGRRLRYRTNLLEKEGGSWDDWDNETGTTSKT